MDGGISGDSAQFVLSLVIYSYLTHTIQLLLDIQMMRLLQPPSLYLAVWVVEATWAAGVVELKDQ